MRAQRSPWLVVAVVLTGAFAVGINFTILAVSRPVIAKDLGVDAATFVWLISGPILANALVTTAAGRLGDLHGHRRLYLWGMVASAVFAALSVVAWDGPSLVAFRVLGAIAGAAAGPSSMAIINLSVEPAKRSRALGYWSLVGAGAPVVGLIVGGPLVDAFGWRSVFAIQAPLVAIAVAIAWRLLPETPRAATASFDVVGNLVLAAAVVAVLVAAERGRAWGPAGIAACLSVAAAAVAAFVVIERRVSHPLIPLRYFGRRGFVAPIVVLLFAQFGYMGGFILAPRLLVELGHRTATATSQLLIPRPLTFAVAGVAAGYLVARIGVRVIAAVGTALVAASLVAMSLVSTDLSIPLVLAAIAVSGLGMGAVQPALSTTVANAVDDVDLGVAGATIQMVAQIATSLGMNLLDSLEAGMADRVGAAHAYSNAYLIGAAITAVGVAAAWMLPRRPARAATR